MSTTNTRSQALPGIRVRERAPAAAEPGPGRRRARNAGWQRAVSPIALLVVWQLTNVVHLVSPTKLPPPTKVVSEAWTLITTNSPAYGGTLQHALLVSLERMAIGFAFGGAAALLLALVAGLSRRGEEAIDPLMQMVRTLPLFGLVPVFIVWFGIGQLPKILLIAIAAVVPLYLNAFSGIRGVDGRLRELARSLGLSRRETITQIVLPGALPATLVGLRQSLGVAWLALVVAEQINANSGLGFIINQGEQFNQNNVIFVALIVYTILGLLTDWIVRIFERRALAWRTPAGARA
jgi:sulfonate transport system permease protein